MANIAKLITISSWSGSSGPLYNAFYSNDNITYTIAISGSNLYLPNVSSSATIFVPDTTSYIKLINADGVCGDASASVFIGTTSTTTAGSGSTTTTTGGFVTVQLKTSGNYENPCDTTSPFITYYMRPGETVFTIDGADGNTIYTNSSLTSEATLNIYTDGTNGFQLVEGMSYNPWVQLGPCPITTTSTTTLP
jgi:hypothetical protein